VIPVGDTTFFKGEWMETGEDPHLSPTVFLAEQPADYTLETHFHRQNQFQLFVEGTATMGRTEIGPVTVHYAGAYTGYGPLVAGPEGVKYFTIRPVFDTGIIPATQARERMIRGPKRHAQTSLGAPWTEAALGALTQVQDRFALEADRGLAVRHLRLPPVVRVDLAHVTDSAGLFVFVLAGAATVGDHRLGPWESAFATRDELLVAQAGSRGAELVVLHVPPTAGGVPAGDALRRRTRSGRLPRESPASRTSSPTPPVAVPKLRSWWRACTE
jgi:hypothetical protein